MSAYTYVYARHRNVLQVVRYGVSGVMGGLVQVASLYVFVDWLTVWYIYGVALAFLISLVCTFVLQKFWTFQDYSTDTLTRQSFFYVMIAVGTLALNVVLMYVLVDVLHYWYIVAQIIVVGTVGVLSFFMNKALTFKSTPTVD